MQPAPLLVAVLCTAILALASLLRTLTHSERSPKCYNINMCGASIWVAIPLWLIKSVTDSQKLRYNQNDADRLA